jgi:hypothetical protein
MICSQEIREEDIIRRKEEKKRSYRKEGKT